VGDWVTRSGEAAGIAARQISPHALRHACALRALRHGGNVVAVSKLLGHASIATTQRFLDHLQATELRRGVPHVPV
jgi:site-specific recombinase XerD